MSSIQDLTNIIDQLISSFKPVADKIFFRCGKNVRKSQISIPNWEKAAIFESNMNIM